MEFWICFYSFLLLIYLLGTIAEVRVKKYLLVLSLITLWFVGAFRSDIGSDYSTYEQLYNGYKIYGASELESFEIEPTFIFIVSVLNNLSCTSQSMFLVYETIVIAFMYLGLKKFSDNIMINFTVVAIYAGFPLTGGYWWDLNGVRQAAAISISFWGMGFLYESKYVKYLVVTFCAVCMHYSALIVFIIFIFRGKLIPKKIIYIFLLIGFVFNATGISANIIMFIGSIMASLTGKYELATVTAITGTVRFAPMAFFLTIIYILLNFAVRKNKINTLISNSAAIYLLLHVFMSFGIEESVLSSVVHRFEAYFLFGYILYISSALYGVAMSQKNLLIRSIILGTFVCAFFLMMIRGIYYEGSNVKNKLFPNASSGNIEYRINYKFIDE